MVVLDRLVDVGERLRLDPLRGVDHQQRALARGKAAADLVGEVDVAGGVHEVEGVGEPVLGGVVQAHRLRLDGDPALLLDVHVIKHLRAHLARGEAARALDQPVGEGRLAMVDVGNDREITDEGQFGHCRPLAATPQDVSLPCAKPPHPAYPGSAVAV